VLKFDRWHDLDTVLRMIEHARERWRQTREPSS
jgi:hypothetical protein